MKKVAYYLWLNNSKGKLTMSQKTKQEYLEAAAKARQASNAALPELASATGAFEAAKNARAILQQNLQNTTDFQTKQELTLALKQFDNTVYNPAKTALDVANKRVSLPLQQESQLIRQANSAASAPENSNNISQPANNNPGDATQYNNIPQYQSGAGVSGPTNIPEQQTNNQSSSIITNNSSSTVTTPDQTQPESVLITKTLDAPQAPASEPVENTGVVQTFAVKPQATITTTSIPDESTVVKISNPTAEQIAFLEANSVVIQPQESAEQYVQAKTTNNRVTSTATTAESYTPTQSTDTPLPQGDPGRLEPGQRGTIEIQGSRRKLQDWRFRISLAPTAEYMYKIANESDILHPLKATDGVIFPYTPQISVIYSSNYDQADIVHSNYKIYNYRNSSVDNISIIGDFTAQDTTEANYVLAVMHFFRSVTKMFYGQDSNPTRGVPPPICYLTGYGKYAFNMHPVLIQNFTLSYPNDVDYINAGAPTMGQQITAYAPPTSIGGTYRQRIESLRRSGLAQGGITAKSTFNTISTEEAQKITRVPTKLTIALSAIPIITRNDVSNNFSLKEYATGALLSGNTRSGRGIW